MHYRICNDGIEDQWIEADDPVEIEPGVIKLYGDCTPDEIQAAKTHWNRITAILDELDRLGKAAVDADAKRAKELLPGYACDLASGKSVTLMPYSGLRQILNATRLAASVMGIT